MTTCSFNRESGPLTSCKPPSHPLLYYRRLHIKTRQRSIPVGRVLLPFMPTPYTGAWLLTE
jgi:hypothetical protein